MTRYGCCGKVSNIGIQKLQPPPPPPGTYGQPFSACIGLNISECQSATIVPNKVMAYIEETITFTISTVPTTTSFNIEIRDQDDNLIGSCTTSTPDGTCTVDWNTTGSDPGEYNIRVTGQCSSDPITITLQPVVVQAGLGAIGMVLVAGLAVGAIYIAMTKPK